MELKGDSCGMKLGTESNGAIASARGIILVAMTRDGLIGTGDHIPWHMPTELQLFRAITLGGTVVMGRNTFMSLGRPLAQRSNIVISTTLPTTTPGIRVCRDFPAAVAAAEAAGGKVFYIGGREIYRLALERVELMRISWIPGVYAGEHYFPEFDRRSWRLAASTDHGDFVHECFLRQR